VVELMSSLQKPIISHNGILDLMFLYDRFYKPLPETAYEFKIQINKLFPHIYDNKHIVNTRIDMQQIFPKMNLTDTYKRTMMKDFEFG